MRLYVYILNQTLLLSIDWPSGIYCFEKFVNSSFKAIDGTKNNVRISTIAEENEKSYMILLNQ